MNVQSNGSPPKADEWRGPFGRIGHTLSFAAPGAGKTRLLGLALSAAMAGPPRAGPSIGDRTAPCCNER